MTESCFTFHIFAFAAEFKDYQFIKDKNKRSSWHTPSNGWTSPLGSDICVYVCLCILTSMHACVYTGGGCVCACLCMHTFCCLGMLLFQDILGIWFLLRPFPYFWYRKFPFSLLLGLIFPIWNVSLDLHKLDCCQWTSSNPFKLIIG